MDLQTGDLVATSRNLRARAFLRRIRIRTPGVVTAVRTHRSGELRYTVAFEVNNAPGAGVVIKGLRAADLVRQ